MMDLQSLMIVFLLGAFLGLAAGVAGKKRVINFLLRPLQRFILVPRYLTPYEVPKNTRSSDGKLIVKGTRTSEQSNA
ncbi:hypothetical protein IB286_01605 [Spongiibacter sp. KMU-158]|uniref:Uncharacterized protein n=1 Tax=Spongiibacter pelagi TaxID=2760804 RepID=A0A927BY37_9GAMM|nr:hypothetical protein [Spongiibacter pelagi]MBD2857684.1 hypothetical protein [Spongiibacter pelagi]